MTESVHRYQSLPTHNSCHSNTLEDLLDPGEWSRLPKPPRCPARVNLSDPFGQGDQTVTSVLGGSCVATLPLEKMSHYHGGNIVLPTLPAQDLASQEFRVEKEGGAYL